MHVYNLITLEIDWILSFKLFYSAYKVAVMLYFVLGANKIMDSQGLSSGEFDKGEILFSPQDREFLRGDIVCVWVRCREALSFASSLQIPVHIVNKCGGFRHEERVPKSVKKVYNVANLGDEAVGYLHWIVKNYASMPEYIIFAHGVHDRSFASLPYLVNKCLLSNLQLPKEGYLNLNCFGKKRFLTREMNALNVQRAAEEHFNSVVRKGIKNFTNLKDSVVKTCWGNTWLVSRVSVLRWPGSFYRASLEGAVNTEMQQDCESCKMLYNHNGLYFSPNSRKYPRHTEVGIYFEYAFDFIWNGGSFRKAPLNTRAYSKVFSKRCLPDEKRLRRKGKKFNPRTWTEELENSE